MSEKLEKQIFDIQELLKNGLIKEAREHFLTFKKRQKVPRFFIGQFAELARKLGLIDEAIALLFPLIHQDQIVAKELKLDNNTVVSTKELLCYASCLIRKGLFFEGRKILETINTANYPDVSLFRAFAAIGSWDYAEAKKELLVYLQWKGLTQHQLLVAKLNLLACESYLENTFESEKLAIEVMALAEELNHRPIYHAGKLMLAETKVLKGEYHTAEKLLADVSSFFTSKHQFEYFALRKWRLLAKYYQSPAENILQELKELKEEAYQNSHFEIVRSIDFNLCQLSKDLVLARYLYFGTPYYHYRQKMKHDMPWLNFEGEQEVLLGRRSKSTSLEKNTGIDFKHSQLKNPDLAIKPGQLNIKLFQILFSDFYKPISKVVIHEGLYRGDFFNPYSSPKRINTAIGRLRAWLVEQQIGLEIIENKGLYKFKFINPIKLFVFDERRSVHRQDKADFYLLKFIENWQTSDTFDGQDFVRVTQLNRKTALRIIKELRARNQIEMLGQGKNTFYRIKKSA